MHPFPSYQQSYTRQMAWSLFAPDLFSHWQSPIKLDEWTLTWLDSLDRLESPSEQPRRLGIHFEQLLFNYFNVHPDWELIAHNLQVKEQGRTLGEMDFLLIFRPSGDYYHIESTVKFYLNYQGEWLGPNAKDRLIDKYHRLINHQIRLSEQPAAKELLQTLGVKHPPIPAIHARGWLFEASPLQWPEWLNTEVQRGLWLYADQLTSMTTADYSCIEKKRWLDPEAAKLSKRCQDPGQRSPQMVEVDHQRYFLVPSHWPNHHNNNAVDHS